ncbi:MAG: hypothetical protein IJV27_09430 [Prevotella sp.]|nr:hypothetical protein [Prevotella sp.]
MNKKFFWNLLTFMLVAMLSVSFVSCSSDDDDSVDNSIVGTWEDTNYIDGTWQWTFNSNGKGSCKVSDRTTYTFTFDFSFNGSTLKISGEEDGERYTDTYSVSISSDGKTMTWTEEYNGYTYTTVLKKI